MSSSLVCGSQ